MQKIVDEVRIMLNLHPCDVIEYVWNMFNLISQITPLSFLPPYKFSHPLYLPNVEQLRKNKHTTTIKTLKNKG
jgi:hypothetical protein